MKWDAHPDIEKYPQVFFEARRHEFQARTKKPWILNFNKIACRSRTPSLFHKNTTERPWLEYQTLDQKASWVLPWAHIWGKGIKGTCGTEATLHRVGPECQGMLDPRKWESWLTTIKHLVVFLEQEMTHENKWVQQVSLSWGRNRISKSRKRRILRQTMSHKRSGSGVYIEREKTSCRVA